MTEIIRNKIQNYNNKYKQIELLVHKLQLENVTKNIEISRLKKRDSRISEK